MAMDVASWCRWGTGDIAWEQSYSKNCDDRLILSGMSSTESKSPIWRLLWRKIKKEKRKLFDNSTTVRFSYDPCSYAHNFDEGLTQADLDDLSRSFSARFAVPSRMFEQGRSVNGMPEEEVVVFN